MFVPLANACCMVSLPWICAACSVSGDLRCMPCLGRLVPSCCNIRVASWLLWYEACMHPCKKRPVHSVLARTCCRVTHSRMKLHASSALHCCTRQLRAPELQQITLDMHDRRNLRQCDIDSVHTSGALPLAPAAAAAAAAAETAAVSYRLIYPGCVDNDTSVVAASCLESWQYRGIHTDTALNHSSEMIYSVVLFWRASTTLLS